MTPSAATRYLIGPLEAQLDDEHEKYERYKAQAARKSTAELLAWARKWIDDYTGTHDADAGLNELLDRLERAQAHIAANGGDPEPILAAAPQAAGREAPSRERDPIQEP